MYNGVHRTRNYCCHLTSISYFGTIRYYSRQFDHVPELLHRMFSNKTYVVDVIRNTAIGETRTSGEYMEIYLSCVPVHISENDFSRRGTTSTFRILREFSMRII